MLPGNRMAACQNLRLHRAGNVHEINAAASRLRWLRRCRNCRLRARPSAKSLLDGLQHHAGIEVADQDEQSIFRRIEIAINTEQIITFVGCYLFFCGRDLRVRMRAEQNFSQAFAAEEAGLRSVELYFFDLLAALALELTLRKSRFCRKFPDHSEKGLGKFRETCERNGAIVRASAGREIRD